MDGLSGPRATWLAAVGTGLSALHGLVNVVSAISTADPQGATPERAVLLLISVCSVLSACVWCWFFTALYREKLQLTNPVSLRTTIVLALLFVLVPRLLVLGLQAYSSIILDSSGIFTVAVAGLSIAGWTYLLLLLRSDVKQAGARCGVIKTIAFLLAVVTLCQSLPAISGMVSSLVSIVHGSLAVAWRAGALGAMLWRVLVTPVVNLFYWVAQIVFLLALRENAASILPGSQVSGTTDGILLFPANNDAD